MNNKEVIGKDSNGYDLHLGDCCSFEIDNEKYIGVITYCEEEFAYCFEINDDNFLEVFMHIVDYCSIEKIR